MSEQDYEAMLAAEEQWQKEILKAFQKENEDWIYEEPEELLEVRKKSMLIEEIGTRGVIDHVSKESESADCQTLISPNIIIKSHNQAVGALQKFNFTETSTNILGHCERIMYSNQNIIQAFTGHKYKTIAEIKSLFNITIEDNIGNLIILKNCKIINKTTAINSGDYIIRETIDFTAKSISNTNKNDKKIKINKFRK